MIPPLLTALDELRGYLQAEPVTLQTLPPDITQRWVTKDGQYKVEILPKGDPTDNETLRRFARAVQEVEPNVTGGPIAILESGRTVIHAFFEAGFWALASITILLWIVLRRFGDVLLTIIPLLMAGVVTMELMVLFGMKLNFANIIALPLLLGVGVAFKIYYIMAWRAGQTDLLQSSLTRAVMFSAGTTATAFGSLWLSSHPGTSSMGKLMALALVTTMAAAVLFQPLLMGPPREKAKTKTRARPEPKPEPGPQPAPQPHRNRSRRHRGGGSSRSAWAGWTRRAGSDRERRGHHEAVAAGASRSTSTWPSFTSVRKVLRSTKQGACTALPVGTWNAPKCRLHSITSPSRMPSARSAVAWVQRASVA